MFFAKIRKLTGRLSHWSLGRLSLRVRLTLLYVLLFGITTAVFNGVLFAFTMETLQQDFDDALYNYAVDVSGTIDIGPKGDLTFPPLRLDDGKLLPFPLGTALIQIRHVSGEILAKVGEFGRFDPPFRRDFQKLSNGEEAAYRTIHDTETIPNAEADSYRLISLPLDSAHEPQIILQIAVPMTLLETQIANRLFLLQAGIPLVLIIAILGGLLLSSRALAPLLQMVTTAKAIDATELDQRVPVPRAKDEMRELAQTLNEMLDRIQQAFESQERFIADASHQLLTPLTILKGELEQVRKGSRAPEEIEAFFRSTAQEVESLARIVQDMLLLARVDAGLGALKMRDLYLDEILMETLPRCERLAHAKSLRLVLDFQGDEGRRSTVRGDADLLSSMFFNIIENAVKYSPAGGTVRIELEWAASHSEIRILDQGPGIPPAELPYIFERFRRAPGVGPQIKGYGLGLAIASKIAALHHATLTAENRAEGGALFRIEIRQGSLTDMKKN